MELIGKRAAFVLVVLAVFMLLSPPSRAELISYWNPEGEPYQYRSGWWTTQQKWAVFYTPTEFIGGKAHLDAFAMYVQGTSGDFMQVNVSVYQGAGLTNPALGTQRMAPLAYYFQTVPGGTFVTISLDPDPPTLMDFYPGENMIIVVEYDDFIFPISQTISYDSPTMVPNDMNVYNNRVKLGSYGTSPWAFSNSASPAFDGDFMTIAITNGSTWPPPTPTVTRTATPTQTQTRTPTLTRTPSLTPSRTWTPTDTPTGGTPTETATPTLSATPTLTRTPSLTVTETPTGAWTRTPTQTATQTLSATPSLTQTATLTPTGTGSATPSATAVETATATLTQTLTPQPSETATGTPSPTASATGTPTHQATVTATPTAESERPKILLAGFWNTKTSPVSWSTLNCLALVDDPDGLSDLATVELYYEGLPIGLYLYDDGTHDDFGAGDGVYAFHITVPPGIGPSHHLLQIVATDQRGVQSDPWPYLNIDSPTYGEGGGAAAFIAELPSLDRVTRERLTALAKARAEAGDEVTPQVMLAGYWNTDLVEGEKGMISLLAIVYDPQGLSDIQRVEISYNGVPTGVQLKDDGTQGDFGIGDAVYGLLVTIPDGVSPAGSFLLEVMATDKEGNVGRQWPYLWFE